MIASSLVRSVAKAKEKYEDVWDRIEGHCHEVDIIADGSTDVMAEFLKGCDVLVILTSAVGSFKDGKIFFLPDDGTNNGTRCIHFIRPLLVVNQFQMRILTKFE